MANSHEVSGATTVTVQDGNVTSPCGFTAAGVDAGVKKPGVLDMAMIQSDRPATAAGVYTTNKVQAAPLKVTREHIAAGPLRAVVINAGNANACTGEQGERDARRMAEATAGALGLQPQEVAVASTGVIGKPMPMGVIEAGIARLAGALAVDGGTVAAEAIMTTDTEPKTGKVEWRIGDQQVTIGGMAKGSGMIHPNMATMLGFFTTDVQIAPALLQKALQRAAQVSFNMVSVDGDTSTNDMALILANGAAGAPAIETEGPLYDQFVQALTALAIHLAKAIARDGEGATKLIEVCVRGAKTEASAAQAARAVAASTLFKAAVFGNDANWGRILCAVGYSGADFDPAKVDVYLGHVQTAAQGQALDFSEAEALTVLQKREVRVTVDLHDGDATATAWGCDLTVDYVHINADYRT
ncbi:bifunctional glutamate N-acetyltransferase/amino-acid acetyltransferase ArgJ [Heliophilum fasciatum]|uniref:Arginine biosynthesis bifunctional protein ArgJ n=1 Tax=Heliophilum fasciatum TaxID=35700 RepID=A0A4R2RE55_9FIRM|nr:bifunctional glutamate N-acetyltransferase/amino-acid acetyltransferase ArgJ [Heliophilum fasciatum]MCW2278978.1 glutamate N-acetyltransferase/amino-acid N-acetyltransferase [Heliophilum fasciatum]TCP61772.1 glutamate N-acetyltransferase [Heliophilum fasciatum]